MDLSEMQWKPLTQMVEQEVKARLGVDAGPLDENQTLLVWSEVHRRTTALAHALINLPEHDLEDLVEVIVHKLLELDTIRRVASATSPRRYIIKMLQREAAKIRGQRNREEFIEDNPAATARYESEMGARNADSQQIALEIRNFIDLLSPEQQILLNARHIEGLTIRQMAKRFGMSYSAIASRMFRIHKKLRDLRESDGI